MAKKNYDLKNIKSILSKEQHQRLSGIIFFRLKITFKLLKDQF